MFSGKTEKLLVLLFRFCISQDPPPRWAPIDSDYEYHATKSFLYGRENQESDFIQYYFQVRFIYGVKSFSGLFLETFGWWI